MNVEKKYYHDVKKSFQNIGGNERKYLRQFKKQIHSFHDDHLSYEEYVDKLGEPDEVASSFYTNLEFKDLKKKLNEKKLILGMFVMVFLVCLVAAVCIMIRFIQSSNSDINNIEVVIVKDQ